ncbi:cytochrome c biogenesis protein ResB [Jeongeupia chitinilytica]|nr:cytochrome c biogenesis protein ResB [Jeongeupia chitinilytica]
MTTKKSPRHHPAPFGRALFELFSSMRFAISLLTVLSIASVIGTVLKQNEPYVNYRFEFGDFWFRIFEPLGLFDVYHTSWFLLLLAFLMLSTSLCIWRHVPGMLRDIRGWREKAGRSSLRLMAHHAEADGEANREHVLAHLTQSGFRFRIREHDRVWQVAAKRGAWQKLGYLFAHAAIVVICIGGLLDGNLPLKLMELAGYKAPETRDMPQGQVPEISRLSASNLSFRGNVTVPEGAAADVVFLNAGKGYFVQELPFAIRLKAFHVDYYTTGQPKRFASDIDILDRQSGKIRQSGTVEVNKPMVVDGVAIYQASFGDGGSPLSFARWDLGNGSAAPLDARSQASSALTIAGQPYTLETGDLRVFNIENLGKTESQQSAVTVNKFEQALSQAASVKGEHNLRNLGPSVQFKLRDATGQAVEYLNYLAPQPLDDHLYLVTGMRREVAQPFTFIRMPLDTEGKVDTFMRVHHALLDPQQYPAIAKATADAAFRDGAFSATNRAQFAEVTRSVLTQFGSGGFPALERFLDGKVPAEQRQTVAQTYLKILQGAAVEAFAQAQRQAGLAPLPMDETNYRFLMDSLVATSNLFDYGPAVYLQPTGFTQVQASGFQLTRSPGKTVVYLGSVLLVMGIFCMFYIREERLWVRLEAGRTLIAMTSNRRNADLDHAFAAHRAALLPESAPGAMPKPKPAATPDGEPT